MQEKTLKLLNELRSALAVAQALKVDKSTVTRIANKHRIGVMIGGRHLFSQEDVEQIKAKCHWKPGNPEFSKKRR